MGPVRRAIDSISSAEALERQCRSMEKFVVAIFPPSPTAKHGVGPRDDPKIHEQLSTWPCSIRLKLRIECLCDMLSLTDPFHDRFCGNGTASCVLGCARRQLLHDITTHARCH